MDQSEQSADERWADIRTRLETEIDLTGLSLRDAATEIGISHGTLSKLLRGVTDLPQRRVLSAIQRWLYRRRRFSEVLGKIPQRGLEREPRPVQMVKPATMEHRPGEIDAVLARDEWEMLLYFLDHPGKLEALIRAVTDALPKEERRGVAFAVLNGFKRMLISRAMVITKEIYELEKKYVMDSE